MTVKWSGYTAGKVVNILECNASDVSLNRSAACSFAHGKILIPDPTGQGTQKLEIVEGPVGNGTCDAAHPGCLIVVNNASSEPAEHVHQDPHQLRDVAAHPKGDDTTLFVDGSPLVLARQEASIPMLFSGDETLDVGVDFSKALHLQRHNGWSRFVSMQDHYNLLAHEEEREMLPMCADEGVGTIVWSPLARGRLAREAEAETNRSGSDPFADMLYTQPGSDRAIIEAVEKVAAAHGVSRAQVALAWLRRETLTVALLVGATRTSHIDDAVGSLELELTDDEVAQLEAPYTFRYDFQGVSDDAELLRISVRLGIKPAGS